MYEKLREKMYLMTMCMQKLKSTALKSSYPDRPITARYRFIKNAFWEYAAFWTNIYEKIV